MEIAIIFLLLALNGFFAMYEIALVSSRKARLETLAVHGDKKAKSVLHLLGAPEEILSTIQVGITLIGIISGAFGGLTLSHYLVPFFEKISLLQPYALDLSIVLVVGLITYFSLIIGELVPKSVALSCPEKIAMSLTPTMIVLTKIVYPFVWFLSISTRLLNKLFRIKNVEAGTMTEDELKFILKQGSEQGVIDQQETEMIKEVFRFSDKKAGDLMTHRKEVVHLYTNQTKREVLEIIRKEHYSRYLLCRDTPDEVIGVVAVKDIISLWDEKVSFNLEKIAAVPLFIPETMSANRILEIFKKNKCSFGVVVNEYGAIEGIITLHDLSECILGDILEEDEEPDAKIIYREDGSFLVDGAMHIEDFMDEMSKDDCEEEVNNLGFNTMGGLAMHILDKIPEEGDMFEYKNFSFEVIDMDNSRTDKLLGRKLNNVLGETSKIM